MRRRNRDWIVFANCASLLADRTMLEVETNIAGESRIRFAESTDATDSGVNAQMTHKRVVDRA
jgi:hypothetical protein